jgi:hypothetical protein
VLSESVGKKYVLDFVEKQKGGIATAVCIK